uniref:Uncharacterized protein n=1 Tax=Cannabis sativa TaxID=3483 RepID=A0A803QVR0_CANSA
MIILMNLKVLSAFHSLKVFIFGRCNHLNHLSSHTIHGFKLPKTFRHEVLSHLLGLSEDEEAIDKVYIFI